MSDTDLSKIVGLIMENPKLIEEIRNLSSRASNGESPPGEEEALPRTSSESDAAVAPAENTARLKRRELLSALKPYVSEGRGKAIDSVMSIVDILDMMRSN